MGECLILKSGGGTDTSDATALASYILSGYTAYVNDVKITGTMENRGTVNETLNCGDSYTLLEGYYESGKVTVNSLSSQTSANATAAYILKNYSGWVNGSKVDGAMVNRGNIQTTIGINGSYTIPSGYHSGSGWVKSSLTTNPGGSFTPKTTAITCCAAGVYVTGDIWCSGDANLLAANIKKGVTIFGVAGTWQGY